MYWMAAASMHLLGIHDWAARLPLALAVLALLLAVYALGIRLFRTVSPTTSPDRGGFYAALALSTGIGPYLYTRFYIPDILLALWMTLAVHLFLIAIDSLNADTLSTPPKNRVPHVQTLGRGFSPANISSSTLLPCLAFAAVMAANVLTKGLIGLVFPIGFVLLYLLLTKQLRLLLKLHLLPSTAIFLALAAPWHILAALRTPAIALPPGLGLPAKGGWAWFYLYNEHFARFLGKRIPHDYGLTPVWLFLLYLAIWVMPWTTFLPAAIADHIRTLRHRATTSIHFTVANLREHEAALSLILWAVLVLGFFSISSRQEYYSLPAIPALALMAGGLLARADAFSHSSSTSKQTLTSAEVTSRRQINRVTAAQAAARKQINHAIATEDADNNPINQLIATEDSPLRQSEEPTVPSSLNFSAAHRSALNWHLFFLLPLATVITIICGYFALSAPHPAPGADLSTLLAANPEFYNLSLGHLFDLTGAAMGLFRGPLTLVALSMLGIGLGSYFLRRRGHTYAANLTLAASMTLTLLAAHVGLASFYPILGSKQLALAINEAQQATPPSAGQPNDLIILDGELTSGSTLIFYTGQQVHLINGRVNGLWYGSFWPDSPSIFETEASLHQLWSSPRRIFLFTYNPTARTQDLTPYGPVHPLASAGGKTVLTNR
jgi:hypothetical protein